MTSSTATSEADEPVDLLSHELIRQLVAIIEELELDLRDLVVFGSAPLLAHNLRNEVADIDVVVRGDAWERVARHGTPAKGSVNGAPVAAFCGGSIQFSAGWISEKWDIDKLIDEAEIIQGLPFAQLSAVLAYKLALDRPKDHDDVKALNKVLHPK